MAKRGFSSVLLGLKLGGDIGCVVLALLDRQGRQRAENVGNGNGRDCNVYHVHVDELAHEDGSHECAETTDVEGEADAGASEVSGEALADEGRMDAGGHAVADTVEEHEHEDVAGVGPESKAEAEDGGADGADEEELLTAVPMIIAM